MTFKCKKSQIWPFRPWKMTFRAIQPNLSFDMWFMSPKRSFMPKKKKSYWSVSEIDPSPPPPPQSWRTDGRRTYRRMIRSGTMHCGTNFKVRCGTVESVLTYITSWDLVSMHCATWCPCIVQLDVHALRNLMSMHCATWCPCIVQLDVHALCNLMSMHCATWCPCIVQP